MPCSGCSALHGVNPNDHHMALIFHLIKLGNHNSKTWVLYVYIYIYIYINNAFDIYNNECIYRDRW